MASLNSDRARSQECVRETVLEELLRHSAQTKVLPHRVFKTATGHLAVVQAMPRAVLGPGCPHGQRPPTLQTGLTKRAMERKMKRSRRMTGSTPGRCTLMATSSPVSRSTALYTCGAGPVPLTPCAPLVTDNQHSTALLDAPNSAQPCWPAHHDGYCSPCPSGSATCCIMQYKLTMSFHRQHVQDRCAHISGNLRSSPT